jgi:hypothetical protein
MYHLLPPPPHPSPHPPPPPSPPPPPPSSTQVDPALSSPAEKGRGTEGGGRSLQIFKRSVQ